MAIAACLAFILSGFGIVMRARLRRDGRL